MKEKQKPSAKSIISKYIHKRFYSIAKKEWDKVTKSDRKHAKRMIDSAYEEWKSNPTHEIWDSKKKKYVKETAHEFAKYWVDTAIDAEAEEKSMR